MAHGAIGLSRWYTTTRIYGGHGRWAHAPSSACLLEQKATKQGRRKYQRSCPCHAPRVRSRWNPIGLRGNRSGSRRICTDGRHLVDIHVTVIDTSMKCGHNPGPERTRTCLPQHIVAAPYTDKGIRRASLRTPAYRCTNRRRIEHVADDPETMRHLPRYAPQILGPVERNCQTHPDGIGAERIGHRRPVCSAWPSPISLSSASW